LRREEARGRLCAPRQVLEGVRAGPSGLDFGFVPLPPAPPRCGRPRRGRDRSLWPSDPAPCVPGKGALGPPPACAPGAPLPPKMAAQLGGGRAMAHPPPPARAALSLPALPAPPGCASPPPPPPAGRADGGEWPARVEPIQLYCSTRDTSSPARLSSRLIKFPSWRRSGSWLALPAPAHPRFPPPLQVRGGDAGRGALRNVQCRLRAQALGEAPPRSPGPCVPLVGVTFEF
jgi:hypothetical protein